MSPNHGLRLKLTLRNGTENDAWYRDVPEGGGSVEVDAAFLFYAWQRFGYASQPRFFLSVSHVDDGPAPGSEPDNE